ncbi:Ig-like domain-containing protein [Paenibacillus tarimensis]
MKISRIIRKFGSLFASLFNASANDCAGDCSSGVVFYVATDGSDAGDGSMHDPFSTFERVRDVIRGLKAIGLYPESGITVYVRGGTYVRTSSFRLEATDSGEEGAPVVYRAYPGEHVRIVGSLKLNGGDFGPVTDPAVLERLDEQARAHVVQVSLPSQGVNDFGVVERITKDMQTVTALPELLFNDSPMTIARWPNEGYTRVGTVHNNGTSNGPVFSYLDDRVERWATIDDVWLFGYFYYDWASETIPVVALHPDQNTIASDTKTLYGVKPGARYYVFNSLEELDAPGEWYLDRHDGTLYVYPPAPLAGSEVRLTVLKEPLVVMDDVRHVAFSDLTFSGGRGDGLVMFGGTGNRIEGNTFRNFGNRAVMVNGGLRHSVADNTIYDTGNGGIYLLGGDRILLSPGGHEAVGNHIYRYGRIKQASTRAVELHGVGNRAANNEIHHAPHQVILVKGNNHIIEYNEIYNVVNDTEDAGAIYIVRDWTEQGNVIRHNFFYDIRNAISTRTEAIYFDDRSGGQYVYGNVFRNVSGPVKHTGRNNFVMNNIMMDCGWAVHIGIWGGDLTFLKQRLSQMPYQVEPWSLRYPHLVNILDDQPGTQKYNVIQRNVFVNSQPMNIASVALRNGYIYNNWESDADIGFADAANNQYQLRIDSPVFSQVQGFERIPFERIGRYSDTDRLNQLDTAIAMWKSIGELTAPLDRILSNLVRQARHYLKQGDVTEATEKLEEFKRMLYHQARRDQCTDGSRFSLGIIADALLARWTIDRFAELKLEAPRTVLDIHERIRLWAQGYRLSGAYVDLFGSAVFTSSNPSITEVDKFGTITAIAPGESVVTAGFVEDGTAYSDSVTIHVKNGILTGITLTADNQAVHVGDQLAITVTGTMSHGGPADLSEASIAFASSNDNVATVDPSTGVLSAIQPDAVKITAKVTLDGIEREAVLHILVVDADWDTVLPEPWQLHHYGPWTDGTAVHRNGTFLVASNGENVWNDSDMFTYVYHDVTVQSPVEKITFTATVNSLERIDSATAAGIMMRDHNGAGSKNVFLRMTTSGRLQLTWRTDDGGQTSFTSVPMTLPAEIRLERAGNLFTASYNSEGVWNVIASKTLNMDENVMVGLGLFSGSPAGLTLAEFSDLVLTRENMPLSRIDLELKPETLAVGDTGQLLVRGYAGEIQVNLEDVDIVYGVREGGSIVEIDMETGVVTALAEGTALLYAAVELNGKITDESITVQVVKPMLEALDLSKLETAYTVNEQRQLHIPLVLDNGRVVELADLPGVQAEYASHHSDIASVDADGVVTAHAVGIAKIIVQVALDSEVRSRSFLIIVHSGITFDEDFENGLGAWTVQNGTENPQVSDVMSRSGSYSFKLHQDHQVIVHSFAAPSQGVVEAWFYDDGTTLMQSVFIVNDRYVGVMKSHPEHYVFRYGGQSSPKNERSRGWHQLVYAYRPSTNTIGIYIDGELASQPNFSQMTIMKIADGWPDGIISTLYFDDIRIYSMD